MRLRDISFLLIILTSSCNSPSSIPLREKKSKMEEKLEEEKLDVVLKRWKTHQRKGRKRHFNFVISRHTPRTCMSDSARLNVTVRYGLRLWVSAACLRREMKEMWRKPSNQMRLDTLVVYCTTTLVEAIPFRDYLHWWGFTRKIALCTSKPGSSSSSKALE